MCKLAGTCRSWCACSAADATNMCGVLRGTATTTTTTTLLHTKLQLCVCPGFPACGLAGSVLLRKHGLISACAPRTPQLLPHCLSESHHALVHPQHCEGHADAVLVPVLHHPRLDGNHTAAARLKRQGPGLNRRHWWPVCLDGCVLCDGSGQVWRHAGVDERPGAIPPPRL